jgi:hypothetical protein
VIVVVTCSGWWGRINAGPTQHEGALLDHENNGFGSSPFFSLQFPLQFFMCLSLSLFFLSHHHLFIFYFLFLSLHTHKTRKLERELERTKGEDPNPFDYCICLVQSTSLFFNQKKSASLLLFYILSYYGFSSCIQKISYHLWQNGSQIIDTFMSIPNSIIKKIIMIDSQN